MSKKNKSWFDDHVIVMADSKEKETELKNDLVSTLLKDFQKNPKDWGEDIKLTESEEE